MRLTGYLTVYVNLCWVMGKLIAFGVLKAMLTNTTEWSYRIPYGLQWMWPPFMLITIYFAPESPWWLVRKGRLEEAEQSLRRLCSAPDDVINPKNTIALMSRTIETECAMDIQGSYLDCFRGKLAPHRDRNGQLGLSDPAGFRGSELHYLLFPHGGAFFGGLLYAFYRRVSPCQPVTCSC